MRGPRVTAWLLTAALTLQGLVAVAQPVLIGGYLDGIVDLVGVHGTNGTALLGVTMLAGLAAIARVFPGRGSLWPVVALTVLWFAEGIQVGMGFSRVLAVHVPLGVAIVGVCVALAVWSWTPAARRPRRGAPGGESSR